MIYAWCDNLLLSSINNNLSNMYTLLTGTRWSECVVWPRSNRYQPSLQYGTARRATQQHTAQRARVARGRHLVPASSPVVSLGTLRNCPGRIGTWKSALRISKNIPTQPHISYPPPSTPQPWELGYDELRSYPFCIYTEFPCSRQNHTSIFVAIWLAQ